VSLLSKINFGVTRIIPRYRSSIANFQPFVYSLGLAGSESSDNLILNLVKLILVIVAYWLVADLLVDFVAGGVGEVGEEVGQFITTRKKLF